MKVGEAAALMMSGNRFQKPHLRDVGLDRLFCEHRQGERRRGTALAGSQEPDLDNVVLIDTHDLDVAAIGAKSWPNVLIENSFHTLKNLASRRVGLGTF